MNEKMPPSNLSPQESADWWRNNGAGMDNIKILSNLERECPRCLSNNPCTGIDNCIACGESLKNARRVKTTQHSPGAQNR